MKIKWRFWTNGDVLDHSDAIEAKERAEKAHEEAQDKWPTVVGLTCELRNLREDNHLGVRLGMAFRKNEK